MFMGLNLVTESLHPQMISRALQLLSLERLALPQHAAPVAGKY